MHNEDMKQQRGWSLIQILVLFLINIAIIGKTLILQMIQCNPIYPDQDWSDGGDGMSDNMLNVMPKRSFCPRSFTWNPSLRRCLPSLAHLRSRLGRRSRY